VLQGKKLIVHRMAVVVPHAASESVEPGTAQVEDHRLFVMCAQTTWLELIDVQMEGKKRMTAAEFLRGTQLAAGARLG